LGTIGHVVAYVTTSRDPKGAEAGSTVGYPSDSLASCILGSAAHKKN